MSQNRRRFIGAGAVAFAAAGIGLGWAKARTREIMPPMLSSEGRVPSFSGATAWLNSEPLTSADLRGKAVVVQFWTYTCVNWLRTLPYVRAWADRYRDSGLVVIGVHTPEFSFEHNLENVKRATRAMQVEYPIAVDNDYAIWNAFSNRYWPALYFADAAGRIQHHHFGEGNYDESERVIQRLLADAGATSITPELVTVEPRGAELAADWENLNSPETYLGSERGAPPRSTANLRLNEWSLTGKWSIGGEAVVANEPNASIAYQFHARDLNLVMGPTSPETSIPFRVLLDGDVPGAAHGFDVDDQGNGTLSEQRVYQLIRQPLPISDRRFELEFLDSGAAAYDFTFG